MANEWDALEAAAARLAPAAEGQGMVVTARRRRVVPRWSIYDGLDLGDNWTDVFEPVGRRWLTGGRWRELQTVESAEERVRAFLRDRPDRSGPTP